MIFGVPTYATGQQAFGDLLPMLRAMPASLLMLRNCVASHTAGEVYGRMLILPVGQPNRIALFIACYVISTLPEMVPSGFMVLWFHP